MPQEFHILKCCICETYQVDIVKKVRKWVCKICGEKQSTIKVYGVGSAKDCRLNVQRLNLSRGNENNSVIGQDSTHVLCASNKRTIDETSEFEADCSSSHIELLDTSRESKKSRWSTYLDTKDTIELDQVKRECVPYSNFTKESQFTVEVEDESIRNRSYEDQGNIHETAKWYIPNSKGRSDDRFETLESNSSAFPFSSSNHNFNSANKCVNNNQSMDDYDSGKTKPTVSQSNAEKERSFDRRNDKSKVTSSVTSKWSNFLDEEFDFDCNF